MWIWLCVNLLQICVCNRRRHCARTWLDQSRQSSLSYRRPREHYGQRDLDGLSVERNRQSSLYFDIKYQVLTPVEAKCMTYNIGLCDRAHHVYWDAKRWSWRNNTPSTSWPDLYVRPMSIFGTLKNIFKRLRGLYTFNSAQMQPSISFTDCWLISVGRLCASFQKSPMELSHNGKWTLIVSYEVSWNAMGIEK